MQPTNSQERSIASQPSKSTREAIPAGEQVATSSLPMSDIESLLRFARENVRRQAAEEIDEPLGPGDVLHLRGDSPAQTVPATLGASFVEPPATMPPSPLSQSEKRLADAILNFEHAPTNSLERIADPIAPPHLTPRPGLTLEDLGDVDLDVSIELGRAEILIEDVLKLREGSVVSLDKLAGDPVDIVANGRLVARGELLVIDGKFGVRLSEVL
jgi:flagellar motor switch protein FliN